MRLLTVVKWLHLVNHHFTLCTCSTLITLQLKAQGALCCLVGEMCYIKGHFTADAFSREVGPSPSQQSGEIILKEELDETAD